MSDVQIYGADAADGSQQQQQNVIVAQFLDETVVKLIKAYTERKEDEQQQQSAALAKFTDEAIAKIIQAYAEHKEREQRIFDVHGNLMVLASLIASVTYTAALTPPGGFWSDDANGRSAGTSVWMDKFPRRYYCFFYCNTVSFVSSLCIIILLGNNKLTDLNRKCLFALVGLDIIGLIGALTAGSSTTVSTTLYASWLMVYAPVMLFLGPVVVTATRRYGMVLRNTHDMFGWVVAFIKSAVGWLVIKAAVAIRNRV